MPRLYYRSLHYGINLTVLLNHRMQAILQPSFLSATRLSSLFFRRPPVPSSHGLGGLEEETKIRSATPTSYQDSAISAMERSSSPASHSLLPNHDPESRSDHHVGANGFVDLDHPQNQRPPGWVQLVYFLTLVMFIVYLIVDR